MEEDKASLHHTRPFTNSLLFLVASTTIFTVSPCGAHRLCPGEKHFEHIEGVLFEDLSFSFCVQVLHRLSENAYLNKTQVYYGPSDKRLSWTFHLLKSEPSGVINYNITVTLVNYTSQDKGLFTFDLHAKNNRSLRLNYVITIEDQPQTSPSSTSTFSSTSRVDDPHVTSSNPLIVIIVCVLVVVIELLVSILAYRFRDKFFSNSRTRSNQERRETEEHSLEEHLYETVPENIPETLGESPSIVCLNRQKESQLDTSSAGELSFIQGLHEYGKITEIYTEISAGDKAFLEKSLELSQRHACSSSYCKRASPSFTGPDRPPKDMDSISPGGQVHLQLLDSRCQPPLCDEHGYVLPDRLDSLV